MSQRDRSCGNCPDEMRMCWGSWPFLKVPKGMKGWQHMATAKKGSSSGLFRQSQPSN